MLLHQDCVIVDLETTGSHSSRAGITEYGCMQWNQDGSSACFEQLINPRHHVPAYITQLTGISNHMLMDKPSFEDVASDLHDILADRIFIAHNVRFDFGFLKKQFSVCEFGFKPKLLCTVKLARSLYPKWASHSLDNICKQMNYRRDVSHRAMADVLATKAFLDFAIDEHGIDAVNAAAEQQFKQPSIPKGIDPAEFEATPNTFGVYRFYDKANNLLYVGKSKHMRERLLQHFKDDINKSRAMQMSQQIARIESTVTGGELSALLLEDQQIKQLQPIFNRRQRRAAKLWCITSTENAEGFRQLSVSASLAGEVPATNSYGFFSSRKQANQALDKLLKQHQLCEAVNQADKLSNKACFARQLKKCQGACEGKESSARYNLRVDIALQSYKTIPWPYDGPIAIVEHNHTHNVSSICYIDQWSCLYSENLPSSCNIETELLDLDALQHCERVFEKDMYHIIKQQLSRSPIIIDLHTLAVPYPESSAIQQRR
ncbi:MAG: GIY-YIG nuclease family protein [Pseudomonadales bacterium]|nr:GIY-YIG nuclease family protein [Pseudomonadales bacterium]